MVYCMVLMYMIDVHYWSMVWHMMYTVDVLFMILYLLHDLWYGANLMHG
jgi:hypothetical protein